MARITDPAILRARAEKMLPKGIPASAIESVECDPEDGSNGGGSYWIYLANGYWNPTMGCHTIHEDTLADLKPYLREVEIWADDPALTDPSQGYGETEATLIAIENNRNNNNEPQEENTMNNTNLNQGSPFPVITEEIQREYESQCQARADRTGIPMICGCWGRACRQMNKAEGANRANCQGCPLATYAANQEAPAAAPQERSADQENREHCKRIAKDLEAYANGDMYRCPECGEVFKWDNDRYTDDVYLCPCCQAVVDECDLEAQSLYDYFSDCLDIEYRVSGRACDRDSLRSVRIMVAYGGPTIYIDTASRSVELYWWTDRASYLIDSDVCDQIDDWAAEMWCCL